MKAEDLLIRLLLGGTLGVLGQGIRTITGLKKLYDEASAEQSSFTNEFQTSVFVMSLFVGFVAGALAMLAASDENGSWEPNKQAMLAIIAAGYSGTDFVEGFMKKYLPKSRNDQIQTTTLEKSVSPTSLLPDKS